MAKKQDISFEAAIQELESIVRQLEEGNVSLDDSLRLFEQGVKYARICRTKLEQYEAKIDILLEKEGQSVVEPFEQKEPEEV